MPSLREQQYNRKCYNGLKNSGIAECLVTSINLHFEWFGSRKKVFVLAWHMSKLMIWSTFFTVEKYDLGSSVSEKPVKPQNELF